MDLVAFLLVVILCQLWNVGHPMLPRGKHNLSIHDSAVTEFKCLSLQAEGLFIIQFETC